MKSFVVFGCGRMGSSVARTLYNLHNEVLAIDINEERVKAVADDVTTAIQMDVMDDRAMDEIGLSNFDVAVIAMGTSLEEAIMATIACVDAKIPLIVAKAPTARYGNILKKLGAHQIVYPEKDMGERLAHNLSSNGIMDYIELSDDYSVVEFTPSQNWIGKTLSEIHLRNNHSINVIAIRRNHDLLVNDLATTTIQEGDTLFFFGKRAQIDKIEGVHYEEA